MSRETLHASCVSIGGKGVILMGESGNGKSDLALRLIDNGAHLVSDDYVDIREEDGVLFAFPPPSIRGMIEARGVGILNLDAVESIPLMLAVRLVPREAIERLPEPQFWGCLGVQLPLLSLHGFDRSTEAIIRLKMHGH